MIRRLYNVIQKKQNPFKINLRYKNTYNNYKRYIYLNNAKN